MPTDISKVKKILVVDDERPLANAINHKIVQAGYETVVAFNGKEALVACEKEKFDLIILDLLMPEMDGWTVLEKLKDSGIKIIVTSNLTQVEDAQKAKDLGAVDFLVKANVSLTDIVNKVKQYVEGV